MRYSIASQALCGAVTVSALTVPSTQVQKRVQHVDISNFKSFPTADPKVYFDKADAAIREFFKMGMFNDGPMDASGRWIDRPLAVLEDVEDKLELHFEKIGDHLEDLQDKFKDHFEGLQDKFNDKDGLQLLKGKTKKNGDSPFSILNNVFGNPASQPSQPGQPVTVPNKSKEADGPKKVPNSGKEPAGKAAATCDSSNPHVRFEWSNYSKADRTAFVKAIKCLQDKPSGGSQYTGSRNRYEDLISVHRGMTADIHQTAAFLVWHRYFVWVFEQMLRDECGFNRAMPWWDETKHAGAFAASDVFTNEWFGSLPVKAQNGQGTCIETGVSIVLPIPCRRGSL